MSEEVKYRISKSSRKLTEKVNQGILYQHNKYRVRIKRTVKNKEILYYLGTFNTLDEAIIVYRNYFNKDYLEIEAYITNLWLNKLNKTKTGYFGVNYHPKCKTNPYTTSITVNNKLLYLGTFSTAKQAAITYNNYLLEHNLVAYNRPLNPIIDN